jgi:hypothetical protein
VQPVVTAAKKAKAAADKAVKTHQDRIAEKREQMQAVMARMAARYVHFFTSVLAWR